MKNYLLLTVLVFLGIRALAQIPGDFSFRQTYKISEPAEMSISTNDGFIYAFGKNSNEIEVYFIVKKDNRVVDIDLDELEEHVNIDISSSSGNLEIIIKQKETSWIKNWKDRYYVSLHILAPTRTECLLKTSDGDIEMIGFKGNQQCKTSDGDILAEDIEGDLYALTSDGDIDISNVEGSVESITSDGDIKALNIKGASSFRTSDGKVFASDLHGNTHATTSDGNIILENAMGEHTVRTSDGNIIFEKMQGSLTAQTSDGDIRGDLNSVTNKLYLKTSDGNISVSVPNGLGMNVRLKGEDIHTKLEDFSGDTSDHLIEGTIRGGGVKVELITSDGDINLNYN